jgi:hypothetical protein
MTTITLAKAKWARKMAKAGPRWKSGVEDAIKRDAYRKGLELFSEGKVKPGPTMYSNYVEGVGAVSAEAFQSAVRGKEDKWAERLLKAIAS